MYRFDDDAQATAPVFIKVEFGSTLAGGRLPKVRVTVGKGTDGVGGITGQLYQREFGNPNQNGSATTTSYTHLASAGSGYVAFLAFVDDTTSARNTIRPFSFVIERSRDANGTPSGDGLLVIADGTPNSSSSARSLTTLADPATVSAINYVSGLANEGALIGGAPYSIQGTALGPTTSVAAGGVGPVIPVIAIAPGVAPWQSCAFATIPAGDNPAGLFTTPLCGNPVEMRSITPTAFHSVWGVAIQPGVQSPSVSRYFAPAIRWEE